MTNSMDDMPQTVIFFKELTKLTVPSEIKPPLGGFHLVSLPVVSLIGYVGFPCLVGLSWYLCTLKIQGIFEVTSSSAVDVARQVRILIFESEL